MRVAVAVCLGAQGLGGSRFTLSPAHGPPSGPRGSRPRTQMNAV
jgi:hypothetical protein